MDTPAPAPLVSLLEASIRRNWALPALSDYQGRTLTYGDLASRMAWVRQLLRELRLGKGTRVALLGRNSADWGSIYLGTLAAGGVTVPLLPDFRPADVAHLLVHSGSSLLFTSGTVFEKLDTSRLPDLVAAFELPGLAPLFCRREPGDALAARVEAALRKETPPSPETFRLEAPPPDELASIVYTSGTTGFSKGVMLPHRSLSANMRFALRNMPLEPGDPLVSFLPLAHAFGCAFEFLFPVVSGVHVTFLGQAPSPQVILKAFGSLRPRLVLTVPLVLEKIHARKVKPFLEKKAVRFLRRLPGIRQKIGSLVKDQLLAAFGGQVREVVVGGAALAPPVEAFLRETGFPFTVGYGMTECGPLISYASWREHRSGGVGRRVDTLEVRVDSPDPSRVPGEVFVRGENVMLGYYRNPDATKAVLDPSGWLATGDLATIDADGFIFIRGRSKAMILGPSGQNIYPEEIEAALNAMPFIAESVVTQRDGRLVALVYPDLEAADAQKLDEKALAATFERHRVELNMRLPAYATLSRIEVSPEELEKTPTRKVKRYLYGGS